EETVPGDDEDQNPEDPIDVPDPSSEGEELLQNGSFNLYGNLENPGGNLNNGYAGWQQTGEFASKHWALNEKPFAGMLQGNQGVSTLSQSVEGLQPGSVLSLSVGWINHSYLGNTQAARLEVEIGGEVYAVLTTSHGENDGAPAMASF